jgi:hypothetical protein
LDPLNIIIYADESKERRQENKINTWHNGLQESNSETSWDKSVVARMAKKIDTCKILNVTIIFLKNIILIANFITLFHQTARNKFRSGKHQEKNYRCTIGLLVYF